MSKPANGSPSSLGPAFLGAHSALTPSGMSVTVKGAVVGISDTCQRANQHLRKDPAPGCLWEGPLGTKQTPSQEAKEPAWASGSACSASPCGGALTNWKKVQRRNASLTITLSVHSRCRRLRGSWPAGAQVASTSK